MPRTLPPDITLKCYDANGLLRFNYTNELDLKLVTTEEVNCGFAEADFDLCNYAFRLPRFGDKIVLKHETRNKILWLGEPEDINKVRVGHLAHIKCLGYGKTSALDLPFAHGNTIIPANPYPAPGPNGSKQVYEAGTILYNLVSTSLTRTQNIFEGDLSVLNDIQIPEDTRDYIGLSPAQIWNETVTLTASFSTPLMWFVVADITNLGLPSVFMRYADTAARFRCKWDDKTIIVEDDSYERSSYINGCTIAYASGLQWNHPDDASIVRDHTILPTNHDRDKFVNANNSVKSTSEARALAEAYVARFGAPLRSTNAKIRICSGTITALPPIVTSIDLNFPAYMIPVGWTIDVQNMPASDAPYNYEYKFIMKKSMDWTKLECSLETGELQSLSESIAILQTYLTSRPYQATNSGQPSSPYVDQDTTPSYGPPAQGGDTFSGGVAAQNTEQTGLPKFILNSELDDPNDPTKPLVSYDGVIDPRLVPDYGNQANFGREADSIGVKGFIRVTPMRVLDYEICFLPPAGSVTVPRQDITIKLYDNYPVTGANVVETIVVTNQQCQKANITLPNAHNVFPQGGKIGVEVTAVGGSNVGGSGFVIGVGGKRVYPDLGVTT